MTPEFRQKGDESEQEKEEEEPTYTPGSRHRSPDYGVDRLFLDLWAPRAMSGKPISERELMSLFEAARWASSRENQPGWHFLYATRNGPAWQQYLDLVEEEDQEWVRDGAVLVLLISEKKDPESDPYQSHTSFDAGAAWENFALQGVRNGLVVNNRIDFFSEKAHEQLDVPETYRIEAMAVVGKPGEKDHLPDDWKNHEIPDTRRTVSEFISRGTYGS